MAVVWPIVGRTTAQRTEASGGEANCRGQGREGPTHVCLANPGPSLLLNEFLKRVISHVSIEQWEKNVHKPLLLVEYRLIKSDGEPG